MHMLTESYTLGFKRVPELSCLFDLIVLLNCVTISHILLCVNFVRNAVFIVT
jgi:hypothetical protein